MNAPVILLKIFGIVALLLLNAFFVAAEFALVKLRDTQLEGLILKGNRRAKVARRIIQNLDAALSSTQLGITIASLGIGWLGEPVFAALLRPMLALLNVHAEEVVHPVCLVVGFSLLTFLHIIVGELAPKSLAIQKTLPTSLFVAAPLELFYKISFPAIWALNHSANWILRRMGVEPVNEAESVHSEEELRVMVSQRRGSGSRLGREIVVNAMDLDRRLVRDVMRPRKEITALNTEDSFAQCLDLVEKTRYSRFPICEEGDLDKTRGVILAKDLFAIRQTAKSGADLIPIARKLIYVPETTRLERLLQLFLERRLHFAIVVDEYGGTVGMVTLENILEELVGQIQDEFDQEQPLLVRRDENTWEIDGSLPLHELSEVVGETVSAEGIATTSGWVTRQQGGFPKVGDLFVLGNYELRVQQMEGLRVAKLILTRRVVPEEKTEN